MITKKKIKEIIIFVVTGVLTSGIVAILAGITPVKPSQFGWRNRAVWFNKNSMYIALVLITIFLVIRLIEKIYTYKKAWWALYLSSALFLPAFIGIATLNLVAASLPDWRWVLPLAFMYVIAAVLPFINEKLSRFLFRESFAPQTSLGRNILFYALVVGPAGGVFGAMLSKSLSRITNGVIGYSILGLLLHMLFVWGTVAMVHQAWELRPWKKTGKEQ